MTNTILERKDCGLRAFACETPQFKTARLSAHLVLPSGARAKLLEDNRVYWGNQVEIPDSPRCYGLVADDRHLLVCTYGCGGSDPEIVLYKKR